MYENFLFRVANFGDSGAHVGRTEAGGACYEGVCASLDAECGGLCVDAAVDFDVVGELIFFTPSGGFANFGKDFGHEGLSAEAWDDGHAKEEIDFREKRDGGGEGSGGVEGEARLAACGANGAEGLSDVVFGFDVDGDHVGARSDEAREKMIGAGDHEVDVEEDIVGFVDGLDDGGAKRDVIDEMPVHDVEVEPVGARVDGAAGFLIDA